MLVQANRAKVIFAKKPSQKKANKVHGCIAGKFFRKRSDIVTVTQPSLKRKKKKNFSKPDRPGPGPINVKCQFTISFKTCHYVFTRYSFSITNTDKSALKSTRVNACCRVLTSFFWHKWHYDLGSVHVVGGKNSSNHGR